MKAHKHIVFLIVITARKNRDSVISLLAESGGQLISTLYARGSVNAKTELSYAFGLVAEEHKVMTSCLLSSEAADGLIKTLTTDFGFSEPNTGFAFTVPVEGLSY